MGVNLAGVEVILRLKEQMVTMRAQMQAEVARIHREAVEQLEQIARSTNLPVSYKTPMPASWPKLEE
jgi:hypothetical protein